MTAPTFDPRRVLVAAVFGAVVAGCGGGTPADPSASGTAAGDATSADTASVEGSPSSTTGGSSTGGSGAGGSSTGGSASGGSTSPSAGTGGQTPRPPVSFTVDPSPPAPGAVRILLNDTATKSRLQGLLTSQAASATRFKQLVDGELAGGSAYGFEPWYAALMGQLSGNSAYCRFAVDRTDQLVRDEEALIASNQRATVAADSYLEVGTVIGSLALVYDWCRATTTGAQRSRWITYANQAVWNVWNPSQARWGNAVHTWSGWSIDNPSNNYYYSFLEATMLLGLATQGENPEAPGWIERARVDKLERQLFPTFDRDLQGGGSREGTGYGTAMKRLFKLYDWWEKSTGERIATRTQHTLTSMRHMMHAIVPTLDRVAPTGDHSRDSTAALFDYHREYLQVLMRLFPTDPASGAAVTLLAQSSVPRMSSSFEYYNDFLYDATGIAAQPLSSLATAYYAPGTGQFYSRSSWTADATYLQFACGAYSESHAHRDQGSFVLFRGDWLAYDQNINSHSGIFGDESAHNLVRIEQNGTVVTQVEGAPPCQMVALSDSGAYSYAAARVTPIYNGKAAVRRVEREMLFIKPATLVVLDRVQSSGAGARRVWTLNLPAAPTVSGDSFSLTRGANRLDVTRLAPAGLGTQVLSWPAVDGDMNAGARVDVADSSGDTSVFLHVLGTNGDVASAVRSDAAGQTGVRITFADGRTALVRFSTEGTGGSLELRNSGGGAISVGALPTTVQPPAQ